MLRLARWLWFGRFRLSLASQTGLQALVKARSAPCLFVLRFFSWWITRNQSECVWFLWRSWLGTGTLSLLPTFHWLMQVNGQVQHQWDGKVASHSSGESWSKWHLCLILTHGRNKNLEGTEFEELPVLHICNLITLLRVKDNISSANSLPKSSHSLTYSSTHILTQTHF